MGRNIRIGRGSASVTISTDLQGYVDQIIRRTMPEVANRIEEDASNLRREAQERWPVKSGRSKRAFEDGLRIARTRGEEVLEGFVLNTSNHTYMVKSKQNGLGGKHAWTALVRKPFRKRAEKLGEELGDVIRRRARRTPVGGS